MSDTTVLIDGRNVQRSTWPNLTDEELVERARAWAERNGKRIVLVFDGKAPGGIVGTGGETADDWLIREAPNYPGAWLVTSDRALRAAAGGQAERMIGGGSFLRELER